MKILQTVLISLILAFTLSQCTPKTTEAITKVEEVVVEEAVTPMTWRSQAPEAGPARKVQLGEYHSFSLENGLDVIVVENNKIPRVSYSIRLKHNPLLEGEQTGFVDIAGELITRGTMTKSKAEIDESVDFLGARLSSSGNGMFMSSLTKHKDALLELATEVLYSPAFDEEQFEKVKTTIRSGLQTAKTDPNSMAGNVSNVINYSVSHPYGEIQTEEVLDKIELETCKKYFNTYFKPNNAYLVIVGDITKADAMADAEKYFGKWKRGQVLDNRYGMPPGPEGTQVSFVNKDGAVQSVINITHPVDLKPGDEDAIGVSLLNAILGGGVFSGRLMQNLREDKAFTYGARSRMNADRLAGEFKAFASVRNEVTDSSVVEFLYEINRIVNETVDEEDLQLAKNSAAGAFARSLESPQTLARYALNIAQYNLPKDYYATYLEKVEAVSVADINRLAKEYLQPQNCHILVVGNKDEVAEKLLKFDSDGVIDYYDAYGKKLKVLEPVEGDVSPSAIVQDYVRTVFGDHAITELKSISQTFSMNLMGQEATVEQYAVNGEKMAMLISMGGNVVQEQRFNGVKALVGGMGQKEIVEEGDMFEAMKKQTYLVDQTRYVEENYSLDFRGLEEVEGRATYKIEVVSPDGDKSTQFYDKETKYLLKSVTVDPNSGKTIITSFSDYRDVDGYTMPHKVSSEGAAPFALVMEVSEIKVNPEIPDDIFKIE